MSRFLTDEELAELTGIERGREKRKRVLERNGIGYSETAQGEPRTTWEAVNAALIARPRRVDYDSEPDWGKVKGL